MKNKKRCTMTTKEDSVTIKKMNPEVKKLWVEALRSGKYTQETHCLKREINGLTIHCCLGVLCELYQQYQAPDVIWASEANMTERGFLGEVFGLPDVVRDWAGLVKAKECFSEVHLITLNDVKRKTFQALADLIEENL